MLSPLAAPFHPREGEETFGLVYNNGMPAASIVAGEHEVLHNIQDDALEEAFPPDAAEAAELEAAQDFVMTMAFLGLMVSTSRRRESIMSCSFSFFASIVILTLAAFYINFDTSTGGRGRNGSSGLFVCSHEALVGPS